MTKNTAPTGLKLQKLLADLGFGSRREMERWIDAGRVSVNGAVAKLGDRAEPSAQLRVDGNLVKTNQRKACRVLAYNKPEGEICTRKDDEGRATVFDRLPRIANDRWIAVGRLDINTSGLLLFTNDGELANRLMHPSNQVERHYAVRVFGEVTGQIKNKLLKGVELEDGTAKFNTLKSRDGEADSLNQWFDVTLAEGRNREVRRLWESQDVKVSRLIRLQYGPIALQKRLPQGGWLELDLDDVNALRKSVGLAPETESKVQDKQKKLDHVRLSRMRRSVKKHNMRRTQDANKQEAGKQNEAQKKSPRINKTKR